MILVFSDLDGTLLDHETYSFAPAKPALDRLKSLNIPLILASSKTETEMRALRDALSLETPMIVENGAGIAGLEGDTSGRPCYNEIRSLLNKMPASLRKHYQGFGDWSVGEIEERTGLTRDAAERAAERQFSEPGVWDGTEADLALFEELLSEAGFMAVRGGRFTTIMPKTSKGEAMAKIAAHFAGAPSEKAVKIALGDGANDIVMLEAADHGVIIANPANKPMPLLVGEREGKIRRSSLAGPHGWNEMINALLDELKPQAANPSGA